MGLFKSLRSTCVEPLGYQLSTPDREICTGYSHGVLDLVDKVVDNNENRDGILNSKPKGVWICVQNMVESVVTN